MFKSGTAGNLVSTITTNTVNRELVLGANEVEYMRIKNNGNVGRIHRTLYADILLP